MMSKFSGSPWRMKTGQPFDNAGVKTRYRAEPLSQSQARVAIERYEEGIQIGGTTPTRPAPEGA